MSEDRQNEKLQRLVNAINEAQESQMVNQNIEDEISEDVIKDGIEDTIGDETQLDDSDNDKTASQYADEAINSLCDSIVDKCVFVLPFGGTKQNELIRRIVAKGGSVIAVLNKSVGIEYQTDKELYKNLKDNHLIITSLPRRFDNAVKESSIQCYKLAATLAKRVLIGAISKTSPETVAVAMALQMNGDVFCIPFQMGSKYIGNSLIHDGAILVENSDTLLYEGKFE